MFNRRFGVYGFFGAAVVVGSSASVVSAESIRLVEVPDGSVGQQVDRTFTTSAFTVAPTVIPGNNREITERVTAASDVVLTDDELSIDASFARSRDERRFRELSLGDRLVFDEVAGTVSLDGELVTQTLDFTETSGDVRALGGNSFVFESSVPVSFEFSSSGGSGGPFAATSASLVRLDDAVEGGQTVVRVGSNTATSGLFLVSTDTGNTSFSQGGDSVSLELGNLAAASPLIDELEFTGGELVASGVLPSGVFALELSAVGIGDLADSTGSAEASFSFSASAVSGPPVVPTPSALAGGMVGVLALLRRRRD